MRYVVRRRAAHMPHYAPPQTLLRITKASKNDVVRWNEALHIERSTGRTLDDLRQRAAADRLVLAHSFRRQADRMMTSRPAFYRDAVSRYYYSMYHCMRAVVFFTESGDDYESHSQLPGRTPSDFPNSAAWQNALKDARERRNAADYDPYPKADTAHRRIAEMLQLHSHDLLHESQAYLRGKGCAHV
jgi:uncharacterized protein (UPF0332 family)